MELIKSDAKPEADDRGRQRGDKPSVVPEKQVQRNQLELRPGLVCGGDAAPVCRPRQRSDPEPRTASDAAGLLMAKPSSGKTHGEKESPNKKGTSSTEGLPDGRQGKKKHRRRPSKKKRRWKPYFKLTWEEKKELDERETERASRVRAEMFAKGLPVAPYNTTQFLMEEHDREEPDLNTELGGRRSFGASRSEDTASDEEHFEVEEDEDDEEDAVGICVGGGRSDGVVRAGHAGGEFLQRDFSETYERYHVETLQNMSKQELVREYLELEKCMSRLEEENNWLRHVRRNSDAPAESAHDDDEDAAAAAAGGAQRVRELESEVERLKALNSELLYQQQGLNGCKTAHDAQ